MITNRLIRHSLFHISAAGCAVLLGQGLVQTPGLSSVGTLLRIFLPFLVASALMCLYAGFALSPAGGLPSASPTPFTMKCLSVGVALLISALVVRVSALTGLTLLVFSFCSGIGFCVAAALMWLGPSPFYGYCFSLLLLPLFSWLSSEFPVSLWRQMLVGPFTVTPVILLIGVCALAAGLRGSGTRAAMRRAPLFAAAVAAFLGSGLAAAFRAPEIWKGLQQWLLDCFFPFLGMFIVFQTVDSRVKWRRGFETLIFCGAAMALLGGYLFFRSSTGGGDIRQLYGANLSVNLPSGNLAQILLLLLPVVFVLAAQSSGKRQLVFAGLTAVFLFSIVFSYSRSSVIAMFVSLALLLKLPRLRRWMMVIAAGTLLFAAARPAVFKDYVLTRIDESRGKSLMTDNDIAWRMEAWQGSLRLLKDHPGGVGLGQWNRHAPSYTPSRTTKFSEGAETVFITSPHNLLLNFGTEAGWVGLASLLLMLACLLRIAWQRVVWVEGDALRYGAFAGLIAFLIAGFLGTNPFSYKLNILPGLIFWSFAGLILSIRPVAEARSEAIS